MRQYQRSKSGLFLMELLLNLLLFSALCGCGLLFFVKSYHLTQDTTTLHQAVRISTSMAAVYESGDGTLESLSKVFQRPAVEGSICIYYDENYEPCIREAAVYYVLAHLEDTTSKPLQKLDICFYDMQDRMIYNIKACNYTASTPGREVTP